MSQDTESITNFMIIKDQYPELLQKVLPFTKSDNKIIKRLAYDFNILLKCAINDTNNETLKYLNNSIEHVIEYFSQELLDLINNRIDPNLNINNVHYGLINDVSKIIIQQMLFQNKLAEVREFLLKI